MTTRPPADDAGDTATATTSAPAGAPASATLWRDANFTAFWTAQALSQLGSQLGHLAFPVLAVTLLGATEFEIGVLNAAGLAAFLVVGLPAGAWVDRWLKRRTMITADLMRMAAMSAVPLLWWSGSLEIWHLYLVSGVVGVATVFFDVSYQSFVPLLVVPGKVGEANAKLEATAQIARIGGPAAGGALLTVVSAPLLFIGESLGYLLSAVFLARTRDQEQKAPVEGRNSLATEIKEGLSFVVRHPLISRIVLCTGGMNFSGMIIFTLLPLLVLRELGLGPQGMGIIMSVGAAGGLLGAVAGPWLARRIGEGRIIPAGALFSALCLILVPVAAMQEDRAVALLLLAVSEFGTTVAALVYNVMQVTMRQRVCPPRLLGRMNASIRFVVWGVMPVAALAGGYLGEHLGIMPAMWLGVAGSLLAVLPVLFSPLPGIKKLPDTVEAPSR
ncbi:MFS transporter [Arthrobacter sp. B3I4]|uniref:MFS transporter n=1 Tax=Arthrobacter sp. B3I4 TaxID=3042267 RepID=UPI0027D83061|nr:MFS transporter [Arthrobacter sp. B3I4]